MKQLKHMGGAPGFAQPTGAPKSLMAKHRISMNTNDPSKGPAPNSGQTATSKGGRGRGSNSPKE